MTRADVSYANVSMLETCCSKKSQDNAPVNWHHPNTTNAGIYSISAFTMPQECTVTNVTGASYYYYYYYYSLTNYVPLNVRGGL